MAAKVTVSFDVNRNSAQLLSRRGAWNVPCVRLDRGASVSDRRAYPVQFCYDRR